jgi:hypothetical protein
MVGDAIAMPSAGLPLFVLDAESLNGNEQSNAMHTTIELGSQS